jgi:hypothetical protein
MGKSLTIQQALTEVETQLSSIPKQQMSASATKHLATALDLIRGTQRAYAKQKTGAASKTAIKPPPAQAIKPPAESPEARRKRLLNSTPLGAATIQREAAAKKGKGIKR